MGSRWHLLLAICFSLRCCSGLANATDNSTTSGFASGSTSRTTSSASTLLSDAQTDTTSLISESSSSSSGTGLGSFILQGLGVTQSTTASSASSTTSSSAVSSSATALNATQSLQSTIVPTSNGSFQDAQSCNSASKSWLSVNKPVTSTITSTLTSTYSTSTLVPPNGTVFTLCDHYPRVHGTPVMTVRTYSLTLKPVSITTISAPCTGSCPSCTIGEGDCSSLWESHFSDPAANISDTPACIRPAATPSSSTSSNSSTTSSTPTITSSGVCPLEPTKSGIPKCYFTAGPVRLVYFPPEIKGDRLCGNYTTVPPSNNISTPVTAETLGTTFTSGTAYVSFESLDAFDVCGQPTGTPMTNFYVPLPSSDVSSMCGGIGDVITGPTPTSLNYADLQTPIALDVYKCQPKCLWGGPAWSAECPTIYDNYAPALAYPTQVKQLQPAWDDCWFNPNEYFRYQYGTKYYLFDPPIALTKTNSEAGVTVPAADTPPSQVTTSPIASTSATSEAAAAPPSPAPAVTAQPIATSVKTLPQTTSVASSDVEASSLSDDPTRPSNGQATAPSQPGQTPETVLNPDPTHQSDDPVAATPSAQPTDALGVFSDAVSVATTTDTQPAGSSQAKVPADSSIESAGPAAAVADPSSAQGLVVGSSVIAPLSQGQATSIDIPDADPVAVSRAGSVYIVAGQTLTPGQAATVQGQQVSVVSPNDAQVTPADIVAPAPMVSISRSGSNYIVDGNTVTPGQATTVDGQVVSLDPEASAIVLGSNTIPLQPGAVTSIANPEAAPGVQVSRSGSVYFVGGTALSPGQSAIVNGQTISEDSAGQHIFVGTKQISLSDGGATTMAPNPAAPTAIAVSRSGSAIIVDGTTLSPGVASIVDGQTVSVLPNGKGVLLGSQTVSLSDGSATTIVPPYPDATEMTLSRSGSSIVVDGTTLSPGDATVIDGQAVSVLSSGKSIVVGSRTIALSDGEATTAIVSGSLSAEGLVAIGSKTLTAYDDPAHSSEVVLDGKTLTVGGPALTTEGETLSLGSSGLVVIEQGHSSTVPLTGAGTTKTSPTPTTAGGVVSRPAGATATSRGHSFRISWASSTCLIVLSLCWSSI